VLHRLLKSGGGTFTDYRWDGGSSEAKIAKERRQLGPIREPQLRDQSN
jgi:hypothetical protein